MKVSQRDIVEVHFFDLGPHPAIIVSVDDIFESEGFFYAVIMSKKNLFPEFTFPVSPDMINRPRNNRTGFALCHQMHIFFEHDIINRDGSSLKIQHFKEMITQINNVIFGV